VENVKRIDFAYWDSDKKDWVDEWDTRRVEKKSILPVGCGSPSLGWTRTDARRGT
jgi:hypothetical protein